ncbi:1301_t:CDS:10 [Paraglomus occultum]|uniref:1301_t:CDS:1 n=1 Tax=Paraglomus occultum TaxID=144539 RepID=A0A9N8VYW4_9GLOM|nr:1301_t:CDS:10 [Paraglomus occultum]
MLSRFYRHVAIGRESIAGRKLSVWNVRRCRSSILQFSTIITQNHDFQYTPEVLDALSTNRPVVALESTIITHGMPYPQNLATALEVEKIVREHGSIPATIAIIDGTIHIGLSQNALERLSMMGRKARKTSRRDLALVTSQNLTGATTVAATMVIAHRAGIKVFVTGGIGGVHRDGEKTLDISADLTELSKTPVTVVCAGVKSILDIERTLEYLETQGVPVVTFGECDEFPAFFTAKSGFKSPSNLKSVEECAKLIAANSKLELENGIVIAVPIPKDESANASHIQSAIEAALAQAKTEGIKGKDVTPFLLERVEKITTGKSLTANVALVKNNAKIGSQIAACLANLTRSKRFEDMSKNGHGDETSIFVKSGGDSDSAIKVKSSKASPQPSVLTVGGAAVDITATSLNVTLETSTPGKIRTSLGGVGRNIAETVHRLGVKSVLISTVGDDLLGRWFLDETRKIGMCMDELQVSKSHRTAVYSAIHKSNGSLYCAIADMEYAIDVEKVKKAIDKSKPSVVCIDGNLDSNTASAILCYCFDKGIPTFFEPTSVSKSLRWFADRDITKTMKNRLGYISPNIHELEAMDLALTSMSGRWLDQGLDLLTIKQKIAKQHEILMALKDEKILSRSVSLLLIASTIIVKLGERGALLVQLIDKGKGLQEQLVSSKLNSVIKLDDERTMRVKYFQPALVENSSIINVTGAGDSFVGTVLAGLSIYGEKELDRIIDVAQRVAILSLQTHSSISEKLNASFLKLD